MASKLFIMVETYSNFKYFKPKETYDYLSIERRRAPCKYKNGKRIKQYKNYYVIEIDGQLYYIPEERAVVIDDSDQVNTEDVYNSYVNRYYPKVADYEQFYKDLFGVRLNEVNNMQGRNMVDSNIPAHND